MECNKEGFEIISKLEQQLSCREINIIWIEWFEVFAFVYYLYVPLSRVVASDNVPQRFLRSAIP